MTIGTHNRREMLLMPSTPPAYPQVISRLLGVCSHELGDGVLHLL
jgi:predicted transcriptional regulator